MSPAEYFLCAKQMEIKNRIVHSVDTHSRLRSAARPGRCLFNDALQSLYPHFSQYFSCKIQY